MQANTHTQPRPGSRPWWPRCPAHIRRLRDDRPVMRAWPTTATDPLGRQQPLLAQQPQDPLAADADAVLATKSGAELAVALPAKGEACRIRRISPTRSLSLIEVAGP